MALSSPSDLWIYTVGYGGRGSKDFIEMLKSFGVEALVDVRRWPSSRYEGFTREELEVQLRGEGLEYHWLGGWLGGYRRGGYLAYMETENFKEGVGRLLRLAASRRVCLMCLEASPRACHRGAIAEHLSKMGVEVAHIMSRSRVEVLAAGRAELRAVDRSLNNSHGSSGAK